MICETVRSASSMLARMCMGFAQAQPLFPTPCIDAVVTLSDQHPSVPFDRPPEKAVCLTECLWCLPTKPFPHIPSSARPCPSSTRRSLVFCDTPVTSARRPSNNPHRPLPTTTRQPSPRLIENSKELGKRRVPSSSSFSFSSSFLSSSLRLLHFSPCASISTPSWLSLFLSFAFSLSLLQGYDRRPRNTRNFAWPLFWNSIGDDLFTR